MMHGRIRLRAVLVGVLLVALALSGWRVVAGQGLAPGGSAAPPTTQQIAELTRDQVEDPEAVEPAAVDAGTQAAMIAAELLLVPEEFFVELPLVTR